MPLAGLQPRRREHRQGGGREVQSPGGYLLNRNLRIRRRREGDRLTAHSHKHAHKSHTSQVTREHIIMYIYNVWSLCSPHCNMTVGNKVRLCFHLCAWPRVQKQTCD